MTGTPKSEDMGHLALNKKHVKLAVLGKVGIIRTAAHEHFIIPESIVSESITRLLTGANRGAEPPN